MLWIVVFGIVLMLKAANAWPIAAYADTALAYDVNSDYLDSFYGPWSLDYLRGGRFLGAGLRGSWPLDRYGPFLGGDLYDPFYPSDLPGSPKTTEVAKENYVRDYPYGGTEVGIRDSVSMRNGPWRPGLRGFNTLPRSGWRGLDRLYNPYFDYDVPYPSFRRPYLPPMSAAARPSSLRWGGDLTYLRR